MSTSGRQSREISVALDRQIVIDRWMHTVTRMIVHSNEEIFDQREKSVASVAVNKEKEEGERNAP